MTLYELSCQYSENVISINHDKELGLISVEHDGNLNWDTLQEIKNHIWGKEAVAIEVYPPTSEVINNLHMRHLWLLGEDDWWPNLAEEGPRPTRTIRERLTSFSIVSHIDIDEFQDTANFIKHKLDGMSNV